MSIYSMEVLKETLYSAVICDALDSLGYTNQSPRMAFHPYTGITKMIGYCKTMLWVDMFDVDPDPYALELKAVDSCKPGDILVNAAGGSVRSGIWGELLTTAARNSGCIGTVVHGAVRDIEKMRNMQFPVFASAKSTYDSLNRQRVVDVDVKIDIGGVTIKPGDILFADEDGMVIVPREAEDDVFQRALTKVNDENIVRNAIKEGMKATDAYAKYGIL